MDILIVDDEPIARQRVTRLLRQLDWPGRIEEAGTVRQAAKLLAAFDPAIAILDIQMPGGDGFGLIPHFNGRLPAIIFVTAFDDQALRAFDANAVDYVTKPIEPGRFRAAMERARRAASEQASAERVRELEEVVEALRHRGVAQRARALELWVRAKGDYVRIAADSITHICAERDYVQIHSDGQAYFHNENLAAIERLLPPDRFVRVHRSSIVRIDAVERVRTGNFSSLVAVLVDGTEVRVGRTYTRNVRARLTRAE